MRLENVTHGRDEGETYKDRSDLVEEVSLELPLVCCAIQGQHHKGAVEELRKADRQTDRESSKRSAFTSHTTHIHKDAHTLREIIDTHLSLKTMLPSNADRE